MILRMAPPSGDEYSNYVISRGSSLVVASKGISGRFSLLQCGVHPVQSLFVHAPRHKLYGCSPTRIQRPLSRQTSSGPQHEVFSSEPHGTVSGASVPKGK
jgi:hypothetical protein